MTIGWTKHTKPVHRLNDKAHTYGDEIWEPTIRHHGQSLAGSIQCFPNRLWLIRIILNFLECVYTYVTPTWVTHMWESCHNSCIQVLGDKTDYKPQ